MTAALTALACALAWMSGNGWKHRRKVALLALIGCTCVACVASS